jgi:DNA polymerase-3 subunit delta'
MFNQIVGHQEIKNELTNHLSRDRITHAYLFNGIPGIGKGIASKLFSRSILCENVSTSCGECRSCHVFDAGTHPDFHLIEDEKSIKVQAIMSMIEFIMTKPMLGDKKVVVINEAEKMTLPAQNKLLKIFEEPPSYAVIILVVNNLDALIDTVQSRGYIIDFKPLDAEIIEKYLRDLLGPNNSWNRISRFAQGSIEKALNNASDDTYHLIRSYPEQVMEAVIGHDSLKLINLNRSELDLSKRSTELIDYLLTWLRDVSILKKSRQSNLILNEDRRQILLRQSNYLSMDLIMRYVEVIEETKILIDRHVNSTVAMNHCLLKIQEEYDDYSNRCQI